jgi:hypothetical protein
MEEKLNKQFSNPSNSDTEEINNSGADLTTDIDATTRVRIRKAVFLKAGLREINTGMPAESKREKNVMIRKLGWQRIAALAACLAIVICGSIFAFPRLFGSNDTRYSNDYDLVCTDNFYALFFGIEGQAAEPNGDSQGIWANPITPGKFRTTITLGQALEATADDAYFALKADYVVADEKDVKIALKTAYDYFVSRGFEAGVIDGSLFLAATKAQIQEICADGGDGNKDIGAEFALANPTAEQQALEDTIRY